MSLSKPIRKRRSFLPTENPQIFLHLGTLRSRHTIELSFDLVDAHSRYGEDKFPSCKCIVNCKWGSSRREFGIQNPESRIQEAETEIGGSRAKEAESGTGDEVRERKESYQSEAGRL